MITNENQIKQLFIFLVLFELFLVSMYWVDFLLVGQSWTINTLFDLDSEGNLPSWFSSSQLLLIGITILSMKNIQRKTITQPLLGTFFIFLSMDEGAQLHEKMSYIFKKLIPSLPSFSQHGHGIWMYMYFIFAILLFVFTHKYLTHLWQKHRKEIIYCAIGVLILISGGIGIEIITLKLNLETGTSLINFLQVSVEEFFEMFGCTIILCGIVSIKLKTS